MTAATSGSFEKDDIVQMRKQFLLPALSLSYDDEPLHFVRGRGQYLYDPTGMPYLDCVNNVAHVGHCHPAVVAAAHRQMSELNTNTRYLHDNIVQYARELAATLPGELSVCVFTCSGSEANELALRMARQVSGGTDMLVLDHAYHGNTSSLIDLSPYKYQGSGGHEPPSTTRKCCVPDVLRGEHRDSQSAGAQYAESIRQQIDAVHADGRKVAGFLCESILGCAGQIVLPPNYLKHAYKMVREAGGLCIADEVQVGFGRVGSHFWAFEQQGVIPDIVTMGKSIGNGFPLGAVVTTPAIAQAFSNGMEYFNTTGGSPLPCAIGRAVLNTIRQERLQENAAEIGAFLLDGFQQMQEHHKILVEARGTGLFIGLELANPETLEPMPEIASAVSKFACQRKVLVSVDGPHHNVLKIKPPMCITRNDAQNLLDVIDEALFAVTSKPGHLPLARL
eukprot:m.57672 g.57672  ORF g.57672 m.57672 type:complete len:449 (+) comp7095_c0_seq1:871-2217(+)